ncbi:hypothetical protein EK904_009697 [Melospiza melodia maxima]|nr:hypothetical protein EK904_009697 [Melospiza melodia maxima]
MIRKRTENPLVPVSVLLRYLQAAERILRRQPEVGTVRTAKITTLLTHLQDHHVWLTIATDPKYHSGFGRKTTVYSIVQETPGDPTCSQMWMEGPEGPDTFCNSCHEEPVHGWEGQDWTRIYPGVYPVLVCNITSALTQDLRSVSQSPIFETTEAAHEVTTICVMLPPSYRTALLLWFLTLQVCSHTRLIAARVTCGDEVLPDGSSHLWPLVLWIPVCHPCSHCCLASREKPSQLVISLVQPQSLLAAADFPLAISENFWSEFAKFTASSQILYVSHIYTVKAQLLRVKTSPGGMMPLHVMDLNLQMAEYS